MNFLGFGQSADIDIVFDGGDNRKLAEIKTEDGKKEKYLLYYDGETVSGRVNVTLKKPGSKLEHHGIKIELIGQIELYYDRGNHHEFTALVRELARPGDLIQNTGYPFEFSNVEKPYEVYVGSNVRLRYFLRITIVRRLSDIVKEVDIAVHTLCSYPEANSPIKMEVGIEDCLHIEFEYNKSKYHLKDVIVGKIYFLLVRIKIKHMEIAIIKRETTGSGSNTFTENETIAKYEIMDGAPVKGESIPIRVFLAGYDLTPTMRDINKKFSVRYFLNLVLMDTEDRRYFKQQEITLWRKAEKGRKSTQLTSNGNPHLPSHLVGFDNEIICKQSMHINNASTITDSLDTKIVQHTDPTMGLFTQESPQQESNTTSTKAGSAGGGSPAVASTISNRNDKLLNNNNEYEYDDVINDDDMVDDEDDDDNDNDGDDRRNLYQNKQYNYQQQQQQQQQPQPHQQQYENQSSRERRREAGDGAASIPNQSNDEFAGSGIETTTTTTTAAVTATTTTIENDASKRSTIIDSNQQQQQQQQSIATVKENCTDASVIVDGNDGVVVVNNGPLSTPSILSTKNNDLTLIDSTTTTSSSSSPLLTTTAAAAAAAATTTTAAEAAAATTTTDAPSTIKPPSLSITATTTTTPTTNTSD